MNRFVVVGLGNFGSTLARELHRQGKEVVALDRDPDTVDRIAPHVARAAVGDGRDAGVLRRLGAEGADIGVVSTGDDITASILTALMLRDLRVGEVYVKVVSHDHARIMMRVGVTETVFPERQAALNLAAQLSLASVFKHVALGEGYSLQELVVPGGWAGDTLRGLDLRRRFQVSVVAVHDVLTDRMHIPPDPDVPLKVSDTLVVAGTNEALHRLASMI